MPTVFIAGPVSWNLLIHTEVLPRPEPHTVFAQWHHDTLGGTSAGKALNLRRLGVDVALCTLLGDDDPGRRILRQLRAAGIDVIGDLSGNGSERHVNLMDSAGHRLSIYLTLPVATSPGPGAGTLRDRQDAVLAAADVVVVDLANHSRRFLALARANGKTIWCDLHDYDGRDPFHAEFRDAADVVFVSGERLSDPRRFLRDQIAKGKQLVVCTQGADGAIALNSDGDMIAMPAQRVPDLVDTNGAGDAFFAGFLAAHLDGGSLRHCLERATQVAASCVRSRDLVPTDSIGDDAPIAEPPPPPMLPTLDR
ncbi:carbohydrate kinase family protein [Plantactinospora sp. WMMB782]|uniref:carbohydrate kinase family protein n=1 Tax=Plantactinospora sp. WMMB782 TaxID=3404121 RepID=UPI003B925919